MTVRQLAAVATALACALATPSTAGGEVVLDGARRTHATVRGEVTTPAFTIAGVPEIVEIDPTTTSCTTTSCDFTDLRLTVPRGSSSGRFKVTLTMPRELNGSVALFNAKGERLAKADITQPNEPMCCSGDELYPTWRISFVVTRLVPGTYQLVVFNRGGVGEFTADLEYKANPPDRQRKR